jgi:photosystem II stability/assembly factor-like uncharacterized protein
MCGIVWKVNYPSKLAPQTMIVALLAITLVGLAAAGSDARADGWTSLGRGPDGAQRMSSVAINPFDPKVVYVGASEGGGLFKSEDGGDSWHSATRGLEGAGKISVGMLATSRTSPHTVLAIVGGATASLYRSEDAAASWQLVDVDLGEYPFALVTSPPGEGTVYVAGGGGMRISNDDGRTWSVVDYFTGMMGISVGVDPVDPRRVFASTSWAVHRSDDGGRTWQVTDGAFRAADFIFDPQDHDVVYAASALRGEGGLFKTTDGGESWTRLAPDVLDNVSCLEHDPIDPRILYASFIWGSGFSKRGGLVRSDDGGSSWIPAETGLNQQMVRDLATDATVPGRLYAATDAGVSRTEDGGATWQATNTGLTSLSAASIAVAGPNPGILYWAAEYGGVYRRDRAGGSWQLTGTDLAGTYVSSLAGDARNPERVVAGTLSQGVLVSDDGGSSWVPANEGLPGLSIMALCMDPVDTQVLYAAVFLAGVYKSRDGGHSWASVSAGLATQNVFSLAIDPAAPQTVYAGGQRGALCRSVDGGASWEQVSPDLNISGIRGLAVGSGDPATLYLATLEDGVLTSTDNGTSWSPFNDGLTIQDIQCLAATARLPVTLYISTSASDLLARTADVLTAVTESPGQETAADSGRLKTYPNPCNGAATIEYALPSVADIDLSIYNLSGQHVMRLATGTHAAGIHSVVWDGRDGWGQSLGSGIYVCRLKTGGQAMAQKLLLLR